MGCIYEPNGFHSESGKCTLWEEGGIDLQGCGEDGICVVSDDPDPGYSCDCYESDYYCSECGVDLNIEECGCDG